MHTRGPMARDQMFEETDEGPDYNQGNGDQDNPSEADQCVMLIQQWLQNLPPDQHDELVAKLADLIASAHGMGEGDSNFRSGRRSSARDNRRPGAMDSALQSRNSASFARRFPDAMRIRFGGMGR